MERFTDAKGKKKAMTSSIEAYKRLAEYEATGLTPEEVRALITRHGSRQKAGDFGHSATVR